MGTKNRSRLRLIAIDVALVSPQRASATARCRNTAAGHGITPDLADDCVAGSVGCRNCPWQSGWSDAYRRVHGITAMPAPLTNTGSAR